MSGRIHLEFPGLIAFQYREYRLFWVAAAFSNIGMWTLTAGRLWLMHELTESPVMLGMVPFASLAPILLLHYDTHLGEGCHSGWRCACARAL